jgi:hypothetical protein
MVDVAEFVERRFRHRLRRRCLTDVSLNEREARRRRKAGLGTAARRTNDVIAAIQKSLDNGCSDTL